MRRALALLPATALLAATSAAASAAPDRSDPPGAEYTFAVIGDMPYGSAQVEAFPSWIEQINADRKVRFTVHVGDIKNGSSVCSDDYVEQIADDFDTFDRPLVFTPGDNEWTDCHRTNNGSYDPLERLAKLREVFYAEPERALGGRVLRLDPQTELGYPENVDWRKRQVTFAAIHVVGSNDGVLPWSGLGLTEPTAAQLAEQAARMDAALAQVDEAFAQAEQRSDRSVVIFLQADMFNGQFEPDPAYTSSFTPLVRRLAERSAAFDGPVYLVNGDSHFYVEDQPLATGSAWLDFYGVEGAADNLTRIQVDGASTSTWVRASIVPGDDDVLVWDVVPFTG